ncbi:MAG: GIY-YIG nuclease family protein [Ardenticatenaceae bacterium]
MRSTSEDKQEVTERHAWVYMVECRDGSLYTGWTYDVEARVAKHNGGKGAKYTRSRRPVTLRWREAQPSRSAAMKREAAIKKLKPPQKRRLILDFAEGRRTEREASHRF